MVKKHSDGTIHISTTISLPLWQKAQQYNIKWSEALRVGVTFILSDVDEEFKNPLQLKRKIEVLADLLDKSNKERAELEQRLEKLKAEYKLTGREPSYY
jgi:hypothetical protein